MRIVVFIISVAYIVFTWVKNDVVSIYTTMPKEQDVPIIATTIVVLLLKVGAISGVVFLVKWLIGKGKKIDREEWSRVLILLPFRFKKCIRKYIKFLSFCVKNLEIGKNL